MLRRISARSQRFAMYRPSLMEDFAMSARTIDTGTDHLLARVEDRVATLTMNRPD